MSSGVQDKSNIHRLIGMGQVVFGRAPEKLPAVLGSCIGVAIYSKSLRAGALAHVVLPDSSGRSGLPGKFADTAIPHMVQLFAKQGALAKTLVARISGGAQMFGPSDSPIRVGDNNAQAVRAALESVNIPIVGEHLGGTLGRRITFDLQDGTVAIQAIGKPIVVI